MNWNNDFWWFSEMKMGFWIKIAFEDVIKDSLTFLMVKVWVLGIRLKLLILVRILWRSRWWTLGFFFTRIEFNDVFELGSSLMMLLRILWRLMVKIEVFWIMIEFDDVIKDSLMFLMVKIRGFGLGLNSMILLGTFLCF